MISGKRLHIGSGSVILKNWINIDIEPFEGVDLVHDVRKNLPFDDNTIKYIFAEHFLEHLTIEEGLKFLQECYRVLKFKRGVLRLSTPNLDWVWITHYQLPADKDTKRKKAEMLNRAFYGWGHKNLYNDVTLRDALKTVGFKKVTFFRYGESDIHDLTNLEHHETYEDNEELPHVIVAQAYKLP